MANFTSKTGMITVDIEYYCKYFFEPSQRADLLARSKTALELKMAGKTKF